MSLKSKYLISRNPLLRQLRPVRPLPPKERGITTPNVKSILNWKKKIIEVNPDHPLFQYVSCQVYGIP